MKSQKKIFTKFSNQTAQKMGHPLAFLIALATLMIWGLLGPIFHFSDTWQLAINTITSLVTFLMVFLIQNTQNRDSQAMQLKLDELICALEGAHNTLLNLEELSKEDLDKIRQRYLDLAKEAQEKLKKGIQDQERSQVNALKGEKY